MTYGVTPDFIASRWRALTPDEEIIATNLIGDAEEILAARRPRLAALVSDDDPTPQGKVPTRLVRIWIGNMVWGVLSNPDGMDAQQIGADGSLGFQFVTKNEAKVGESRMRLDVNDADLATLDLAIENALYISTGIDTSRAVYIMVFG